MLFDCKLHANVDFRSLLAKSVANYFINSTFYKEDVSLNSNITNQTDVAE